MINEKLLSIIVPIYNTKKYLNQCISSILGQDYLNIEVILVDDGSTDGSLEVCRKFESDFRVTILHKENEGPMKTRLVGVQAAKGEYTTFVDSDDWIDAGMYRKLMEPVNLRGVDVSICGIIRAFESKYVNEHPLIEPDIYMGKQLNAMRSAMFWNPRYECNGIDQSLCTKVIRKDYLLKYMEKVAPLQIHYNEDTAIVFPLMTEIQSLSVIDDCLYYHRQREDSLPGYMVDKSFFTKMFAFYNYMIEVMDEEYYPPIEQYFLYSLNQRKRMYSSMKQRNTCFYPIDLFDENTKFILYGAGKIGQDFYRQYKKIHLGKMVAWMDKLKSGQEVQGIQLVSLQEINKLEFDYVVLAIYSNPDAKEVINELTSLGVEKDKIIWKQVHIIE